MTGATKGMTGEQKDEVRAQERAALAEAKRLGLKIYAERVGGGQRNIVQVKVWTKDNELVISKTFGLNFRGREWGCAVSMLHAKQMGAVAAREKMIKEAAEREAQFVAETLNAAHEEALRVDAEVEDSAHAEALREAARREKRLLDAATELLAAVKLALPVLEINTPKSDYLPIVRAAIAKAEGRDS